MNKRLIILGLLLGLVVLLMTAKSVFSPTKQPPPWKSYFNSKYLISFSYPGNWQKEEWDIEEAANLKKWPDGTILYQGKFFGSTSSPQAVPGHFEVLIWENKSKASVKTFLSWFRHEDLILSEIPKDSNFTVMGLPATRFLQKQTSKKTPILFVFLNHNDKIYELASWREDLNLTEATNSAQFSNPIYDKILNSFQFMIQ